MSWFTDARALVYLRRLVVTSERIALSLEQIAQVMSDEWASKHVPKPVTKRTELGTFDVEEANRRYEQDRAMMAENTRIPR